MPEEAPAPDGQPQQTEAQTGLGAPITVLVWLLPLGMLGELYRWYGKPPGAASPLLLGDPYFARLGGLIGLVLPAVPLLLLVVGALAVQLARRHPWRMPTGRVLALVAGWALVWTVVRISIGLAAHALSGYAFFRPDGGPTLLHAGLALSGALQEELVFRAGLLSLVLAIGIGLGARRGAAATVAIVVSALLFALAHTRVVNHFPGAEPFLWPAFAERAAAGLVYGFVYLRQGLAVCTLAHAGYNLALLLPFLA